MTRSNSRSHVRPTPLSNAARAARLLKQAGRAQGPVDHARTLEHLEPRVMLAGDHASFSQFPNVNAGDNIVLNATTGLGNRSGIIEALGGLITEQNDLFKFTAVQNPNKTAGATDFVTIRADTLRTPGSLLNTRVDVYIANASNQAVLVASSSGDGVLTSGTPTDGWLGLAATPGVIYYVRVSTDSPTGNGSAGAYTLLIDGISDVIVPNANTGAVSAPAKTLNALGEDIVYSITTPNTAIFDSLATAVAQATSNPPKATDLDSRIDIFDSKGTLITFDDDAGRLNDAYSVWRVAPGSTYYIRVRSDRFTTGNGATGTFTLTADTSASALTVDPVTRRGFVTGNAGNEVSLLFRFQAQGDGLAILTAIPNGLPPVDPALRLYEFDGTFKAFNDNLITASAQIEINLVGGKTYFGIVHAFNNGAASAVAALVEANHTFDATNNLDDYASGTDFANAQPLGWSAPRNMPDWAAGGSLTGGTQLADRNKIVISQISGRIHDTGDTDIFSFVAPVDMLSDWAGKDKGDPTRNWRTDHRPGTRLQAFLVIDAGSFIFTPTLDIFDSSGTLIASNSGVFTGLGFPMGAAAGFWDPASYPGAMDPTMPPFWAPIPSAAGPKVWGGETYYMRVSGSVKGRYTLTVFADTFVDPLAGATPPYVRADNHSQVVDQLDKAGLFSGQMNRFFVDSGTGDSRFAGFIGGTFNLGAGMERAYDIGAGRVGNMAFPFDNNAAGTGIIRLEESKLAGIESYLDSDLYSFTAPFTGTVEFRINTTQLDNVFHEFVADGEDVTPPTPPAIIINADQTKTYDSPLDSALRIFNNDFQQVAYNNDNSAISGEAGVGTVGTWAARTFHRRDARVVINIQAGQLYYVQVESGQLPNLNARQTDATAPVDWGHALGTYELLLHSMPNLGFNDDHSSSSQLATVFPINSDPTQSNNTASATLTGSVETPTDTDLFTFTSPVRGNAVISLSRPSGSLLATVSVFDVALQFLAQATATSDGTLSVSVPIRPGDKFYIQVAGSGNTSGVYALTVSGIAAADDFSDFSQIVNSTLVPEFDFLGSGTVSGRLEQPGDTDVFRFTAFDFQTMTINVTSNSSTLNPAVVVYEGALDAAAAPNAVITRIGFNDDISVSNLNSRVSFPVSPSRTSAGKTFRYYYVVVSGSDRNVDYGDYTLTITFPPTDDHPDAGEYQFADTIPIDVATGAGSNSGKTETLADSDLFKFTAPAGGEAGVIITRPSTSTALPKVSIIQFVNGLPVVIKTGTATEGSGGFNPADTGIFNVDRNAVYYVLIENTAGRFGQYNISVGAPAVDDYPNIGEFSIASDIPLSTVTGNGTVGTGVVGDISNPKLNPSNDSDLFKFSPVDDGPVAILLTSYASTAGRFAPRVRVFDSSGAKLTGGDVSSSVIPSTNSPTQVTFSFSGGLKGVTYYILVSAVNALPPPATLTGEYNLLVDTFSKDSGGGDDAGMIDFNNPSSLALNSRNGDGSVTDLINAPGDRDLFTFTLPAGANGPAFVQVVTPNGSILDCSLTVLSAANENAVVTSDSAGIPGATANAKFTGVGGHQYWVIVAGVGAGVGAYTLRVNTQPALQYLYYPEGYASPTIREFVSISNNNAYDVKYSIIAYYEDGSAPTVLVNNGTISAGARDGITTSNGASGTFNGLKSFTPYSIVIQSNGPIGATLAHYDFNSTVGDSFSEKVSDEWTFARVEKNPGAVSDFILYYNPNNFAVQVTVTAYTTTGVITALVQTVPANQRLGVSINDVPSLPVGLFGVKLTARAVSNSDAANFIGISAALSHYDAANRGGFGFIGDADGGATTGVIPSITNGDAVTGEVVILNPTNAAAIVNLNGKYLTTGLPDLVRTLTIPAFGQLVLRGNDLNLVRNQTLGLRFDSNVPISITSSQRQNGEADATSTANEAGTSFFFGDGFMNTVLAGQFYFETLAFYNPTGLDTNATVKLLFTGTNDFITVNVAVSARGFAQLKLHELPQLITDRPGLNFYSIQVDSIVPIAATLTHYDLFLGGGWTTGGVPLGLTNAINSIT